jgi:hypothetical protein
LIIIFKRLGNHKSVNVEMNAKSSIIRRKTGVRSRKIKPETSAQMNMIMLIYGEMKQPTGNIKNNLYEFELIGTSKNRQYGAEKNKRYSLPQQ